MAASSRTCQDVAGRQVQRNLSGRHGPRRVVGDPGTAHARGRGTNSAAEQRADRGEAKGASKASASHAKPCQMEAVDARIVGQEKGRHSQDRRPSSSSSTSTSTSFSATTQPSSSTSKRKQAPQSSGSYPATAATTTAAQHASLIQRHHPRSQGPIGAHRGDPSVFLQRRCPSSRSRVRGWRLSGQFLLHGSYPSSSSNSYTGQWQQTQMPWKPSSSSSSSLLPTSSATATRPTMASHRSLASTGGTSTALPRGRDSSTAIHSRQQQAPLQDRLRRALHRPQEPRMPPPMSQRQQQPQ